MTEEDIIKVQNSWSEGIIRMGQIANDRTSLKIFASDFLDRLYNFDDQVLFKPTKAKDVQFRNDKNFSLQQGDILSTNLDSINKKITKVIANIPYNITGPILDIFVGRLGIISNNNYNKIIFLMQKDVVDRILAKDGNTNAGALSVRMQLISNIRRICDVPPSSFDPPPKVFSSLVVFEPLRPEMRLDIKLEKYLDKLLRISFNSRRKMIRNTLNSILSSDEIEQLSESSQISFNSRPQDISINKWIKLAEACIKITNKNQ